MPARASQPRLMLELLRGGPKLTGDLNAAGIGRPNSRAAELRRHGHEIVCEHVNGTGGGSSYRYRLVFDAERQERPMPPPFQDEPSALTARGGAAAPAGPHVAAPAVPVPTHSDDTSSSRDRAPEIPGGVLDEHEAAAAR